MSKKKKKNNLLIYGLLGLLVVLIGFAVWKSKNKAKGLEVETEEVKQRTIVETVAASGRIFPVTEVKISSDVSGEVVALFVEEGDSVRLNQLLARIDPDAYESQVERGRAGVNSARAQAANARSQIENLKAQKEQILAQLENAQDIHRRNEQLKKEGVISEQDFEASQTNLRSLQANLRSIEANIRAAEQSARAAEFAVASARATLDELKTSLRRTDIYAPMEGIVSQLNIEKGERVVGTIQMTGTEMMRIADLSQMEVQVDVSENDIPRVSLGDKVDIEVDAYLNRIFKGTVTEIAHSASNMPVSGASSTLTTDQVTNFIVTIIIDPESYKDLLSPEKPFPFRPGMSANVEIVTRIIEDALSVPIQAVTTREIDSGKGKDQTTDEADADSRQVSYSEALFEDNVREVIFLVKGDTVDMAEVKTGIQDDTYIQVLQGIEPGQKVVVGPYSAISRKLKKGDAVTIKTEGGKETGED